MSEELVYSVYYQRFFGLFRTPEEVKIENLPFTHRFVTTVRTDLGVEEVHRQMQGEVWSPNEEAFELIKSLHVGHTSMSVGDVAWAIGGYHFACAELGFAPIGNIVRSKAMPTQRLWMAEDVFGNLTVCDRFDKLPKRSSSVETFARIKGEDLNLLADRIEARLGVKVSVNI